MGKRVDFKGLSYNGEINVEQNSWMDCCMIKKVEKDPDTFIRDTYMLCIDEKLEEYAKIS